MDAVDILIIDDDADTCEVMDIGLKMFGYSTAVAKTSGEAFEALSKASFRIVLLDYHFENVEITSLLGRIRMRQDADIVLCSAVADIRDKAEILDIRYCLPKPFDIDVANKLVTTLLENAKFKRRNS
jgi:DNA-binding response OmpR family regulator